jgi:hypothetical protein
MIKRAIIAGLLGLGVAFGATRVQAEPVYIEVESAPRRVETYPHTVYEGHPAYYVDGRWYYREGPRWAYYREEPRPLFEFRAGPSHRHVSRHHRHFDHEHRHHRH